MDLRMINSSGIGTYIQNTTPLIIQNYPLIKFNILGDRNKLKKFDWINEKNINIIDCQAPIYSIKEQVDVFRKIPKNTALFWSPHYNIPLLYHGKLLITVHDVFHLAMPQFVNGIHKKAYAKLMFSCLSKKADAIMCVSEFTASQLIEHTNVAKEKVNVTYNGVDSAWFNIQYKENPYHKPFLLFVGNVKPHKNLMLLLTAFEKIMDKVPHDLMIVGKKEGFITGDNMIMVKAQKLGTRVHFTGRVTDDVLKQYFVYADALIFPSLYEGFGLPPIEAMACGCPVIVSDAASLPEVCADAALYCDPNNPQDIADKILRLLKDKHLQESFRLKGKLRAELFTWGKCAEKTVSIIEKVIDK